MIQAWQLFDGTTKVHAPKEARSSGTRKGQGPQWVDSCLSRPLLDFQPGNLLCSGERPGSARSGLLLRTLKERNGYSQHEV